ncbi:MAG: cell division protein FtsA [Bacteroidales bacterium]|nr:cell division protein FtsA [Candidatus Physcousia equi]
MVAEKDIIVAFELGSSAIRGVAGQRESDGSITILAIEQEQISGSVRRGTVYNINKTTSAITRIKERLNEKLNIYITRAYVGIAGQSLRTIPNKVVHTETVSTTISQELIDSLLDENRRFSYTDREILDVAPQEYRVGIDTTTEPIGIQTNRIEGCYLNIIARRSLQETLRVCLRDAGLEIVELLITPVELAKALVPDTEKRSGTALVDLGADTTTVSIFTKNILRRLVTIPLGGRNVTADLASLKKMEMEEAEEIKLNHGTAMATNEKTENARQILISNDRSISEHELQRITASRYEEIIANIWNQIKEDKYENELLSGITLTGGAAAATGLSEAFAKGTGFDVNKIKVAKQLIATTQTAPDVDKSIQGCNGVIAILMSATEGCTGASPQPQTPEEPAEEIEETSPDPVPEQEPVEKSKKKGWLSRWKKSIISLVNEEGEDNE